MRPLLPLLLVAFIRMAAIRGSSRCWRNPGEQQQELASSDQ
jgi:hypothetical protein